jgi:hypothetical protein
MLAIGYNIRDKESSSDLETGAEPHRLELEEEFWKNLVFTKKICVSKKIFLFIPCSAIFSQEKTRVEQEATS